MDDTRFRAKMDLLGSVTNSIRNKIILRLAQFGAQREKDRSPVVFGILRASVKQYKDGDGRIIIPQVNYSVPVEENWREQLGTKGKARAVIKSNTPMVEGTREDIKKQAEAIANEVVVDEIKKKVGLR